jgi:GTP-binding protein Era
MTTRCGYVAIVGRPNVGKSTLLNHILGQKISITSRRPQTTRHQVLGIHTEGDVQTLFVDTPGLHRDNKKAINRYMNRAASSAIKDVDLVVMVVDRDRWKDEDDWILSQVEQAGCPVILVINKIDQIDDKQTLLPLLARYGAKHDFSEIVPMSAQQGHNIDLLSDLIKKYLPEAAHFYAEDQVTDRSSRFMASELIREKIMRQLGDELPYSMTVEIEEFKEEANIYYIHALILVERDGQKRILIGEKGSRLKLIGQEARLDMEKAFDCKVMLKLWVKIRSGWSDDERALQSLGYNDN